MAMTEVSAARIGNRVLVAFALMWAPVVGAGELHRWVDESGAIHYTDAPPPESARRGDANAGAGEKPDAAAREAEQAVADERSRRDHMLRQSYSSVADIERTRDRRLEGVDGEIGMAKHRVEQVRALIERYDRLLADLPEDNEHRAEIRQQRAEARERLQRRQQELEQARARRARMEARFEEDIERFRELSAESE